MSEQIKARRNRINRQRGAYTPSLDLLYSAVEIDEKTGCYLWMRSATPSGYGRIGIQRRDYLAHRLSYELNFGPIPPGMYVCHRCDTPRCINPQHLFLGTQDDNLKDMARKGRSSRGERHYNAKLNEDTVRIIRSLSGPHEPVAKFFGVSRALVRKVRIGAAWGHVR